MEKFVGAVNNPKDFYVTSVGKWEGSMSDDYAGWVYRDNEGSGGAGSYEKAGGGGGASAFSVVSEGIKNDEGKVRIELFPGEVMFACSMVLTKGAGKYADRNWEKGISWGRVFGALMRHMWSWWQGRGPTNESFVFGDLDPEWNYSHLWHAQCCLAFLITYEMRGMTEFDDRPRGTEP